MDNFEQSKQAAKIQVVGVGGGGCNAINTMIAADLDGVDFIAANTDIQALAANQAPIKIQLGADPDQGPRRRRQPRGRPRGGARDARTRSPHALEGADMVFVTAGMGGGTGTGAAPVIADIAQVARARSPSAWSPSRSTSRATSAASRPSRASIELKAAVDTLITIPNQRLLALAGQSMPLLEAFKRADEVLLNAVQGISDLIQYHGFINVDFADVKTIMSDTGLALMGTGRAAGEKRAIERHAAGDQLARCSRTSASTAPPACSSTSPAAAT